MRNVSALSRRPGNNSLLFNNAKIYSSTNPMLKLNNKTFACLIIIILATSPGKKQVLKKALL
jgi:hypothetical protein